MPCLLEADIDTHAAEADTLLSQMLQQAPRGEIADKAQRAKTQRAKALQGEQRQALFLEAATLGEKGLRVNDPAAVHRLQTLPGTFTALQLACLIHVGAQQLLNGADSGFGFGGEYQEAVRRLNR
jgi:hypothetical protein